MPIPPKLKRAYADAPTGQVHYYDSMGDGAPLLMVHQAPASSLDYAPAFADLIAAGIRVMEVPGTLYSTLVISEFIRRWRRLSQIEIRMTFIY